MKNRKVLLVPACTDLNRGDQALVWQSVEVVKDIYENKVDCRIIDTGDSVDEILLQSGQTLEKGYNTIRNFLPHPGRGVKNEGVHYLLLVRLKMIAFAIFDFLRLCAVLVFPKIGGMFLRSQAERDTLNFLKECDAVFVKGGGFLHTYGRFQDFYYIWYQTYYIALAIRLGVKVIIFPNSFGPFAKGITRWYLKQILVRCEKVYAREYISKAVLEEELYLRNILIGPDFGYFMRPFDVLDKQKKSIAVTVRPYRFPDNDEPSVAYEQYISAIVGYVCEMSERGYSIDFVVQVKGPSLHETDRIAINEVLQRLPLNIRQGIKVKGDEGSADDLMTIYSRYEILIGTRFHSVIFSQICDVKAIAIAYGGNKSFGIMEMLNLEHYVFDINDVNADSLVFATDQVISDESYKGNVKKALEQFKDMRFCIVKECQEMLLIG